MGGDLLQMELHPGRFKSLLKKWSMHEINTFLRVLSFPFGSETLGPLAYGFTFFFLLAVALRASGASRHFNVLLWFPFIYIVLDLIQNTFHSMAIRLYLRIGKAEPWAVLGTVFAWLKLLSLLIQFSGVIAIAVVSLFCPNLSKVLNDDEPSSEEEEEDDDEEDEEIPTARVVRRVA